MLMVYKMTQSEIKVQGKAAAWKERTIEFCSRNWIRLASGCTPTLRRILIPM